MRVVDSYYMSRVLQLARKGNWQTSPNPMVGAVIVNKGRIIAEGFHRRAGLPHAEIEALKKINFKAHGATLYCNLEPCCHYGKTPPCVDSIIRSGIKRVVISHRDPNPRVSGKSIRILRKSGIHVTSGVLTKEAKFLNRFFLTWVQKKRPHIILKAAISLDGKITRDLNPPQPPFAKGGKFESPPLRRGEKLECPPLKKGGQGGFSHLWITGPKARHRVHEIRSRVDAILVGVNTVLNDNPRLNVREIPGAKQPAKIVLDSRLRIPFDSWIFKVGSSVLIATTKKLSPSPFPLPRGERVRERVTAGILECSPNSRGQVSLKPLLSKLAKKGNTSLLVEGGAQVFESFFKEGLCDEMYLFVSPKVIGKGGIPFPSLPQHIKKTLKIDYLSKIGPDTEFHFFS